MPPPPDQVIEALEKKIATLERTVEKLKFFRDVGKLLTTSLHLPMVLEQLMAEISQWIRPSSWAVLTQPFDALDLHCEIAHRNGKRIVPTGTYPLRKGITGWVIETGQGVIIARCGTDPRYDSAVDGVLSTTAASMMILPLRSRNRVLGVVQTVPLEEGALYTDDEYSTLLAFCDYLALAIENAESFRRVELLTLTDDLTQLFNSRYLYMMLDREFKRFERRREPFSLLFLDMDNLKPTNDIHGHLAGSDLIREVGRLIQSVCRGSDIPTRYGGDEFVVLLPNTDEAAATQFGQRLLERFRSHRFLASKGLNLAITASIGVATAPVHARDREGLIQAADQAMYRIKHKTKNGLGIAPPLSQ